MKKIILALLVIMAAAVSLSAQNQQMWRVTRDEGGVAARNNTINLLRTGENMTYIYFRDERPRADYRSIRVTYTASEDVRVAIHAVYVPGQVWGTDHTDTPTTLGKAGTLVSELLHLPHLWYDHDGKKTPMEKPEVTGIVLRVETSGRTTFTVNSVDFVR